MIAPLYYLRATFHERNREELILRETFPRVNFFGDMSNEHWDLSCQLYARCEFSSFEFPHHYVGCCGDGELSKLRLLEVKQHSSVGKFDKLSFSECY